LVRLSVELQSIRIFLKPRLEFVLIRIDVFSDMRWGELKENGLSFYPKRKFINIIVKNKGNRLASNCEVKLKVLSKSEGCDWLSVTDTKTLVWENGKTETSIKNKPAEGVFCLAFSQEKLTQQQIDLIDPVYCGKVKQKMKCFAWIGTDRAFVRTAYADQDGMCKGEFMVHVEVVMDNGKTANKHFKIKVGDDVPLLQFTIFCMDIISKKSPFAHAHNDQKIQIF
jgi:hypothetical protein